MEKRQEKGKSRRSVQLWISLTVTAGVAVLLFFGVKGFGKQEIDTSQGLQYIKEAEQTDLAEVEKKIRKLERADLKENDTRSLKEKFNGAVVMGDSIANSFGEYEVLNLTSVVAKIGVHLTELKGMVGDVKALDPEFIFLIVGNNDVTATNGDTESFAACYKDLLDALRAEIPDAEIYVNSIPPVEKKAAAEDPALEYIPEYNVRLQALCEEEGVMYVSSDEVYDAQYYEPDGIHFVAAMYTIWAEYLAEVAKL